MNEIKALRKGVNLTQSQFAKKFDIPLRTLQCWEIGQRKPPDYVPKLLEKIIELEKETAANQ